MNAVVTLSIGNRGESIGILTEPIIANYAKRCNSDFICIREPRIKAGHVKFEKFQLYDILESYSRVIYLDGDVLIMPNCPNLFEVVPDGSFGAYFDSNGGNGDAENGYPDVRGDEIDSYQKLCGSIGWKTIYFNSGIIIAEEKHKNIFQYRNGLIKSKRFIDQTLLNYRLQKERLVWFDIGHKFNHFAAFNRSERLYRTRFDSFIIHYAGFNEFYPELSLIDQIRMDIGIAYGDGGRMYV